MARSALKYRQQLSLPTSSSELFKSPQYAIDLITEGASSWIYEPDYSGITALSGSMPPITMYGSVSPLC